MTIVGVPTSAAVAAPAAAQRLTGSHNERPDKPTGLTTSPTTDCTATSPTIVGDEQVTLYAPVYDRDGGVLGVEFSLWETSAPHTILLSSKPHLLTVSSGSTAVLVVPVATLRAAAGGAITQFSWKVRATDFHKTSAWSATCHFRADPTRTDAPVVTPPAEGSATVGKPVTIAVSPAPTGSTPSGYLYQLNADPPSQVTAATDGTASITVVPTRFTNTLAVTGISAGGNLGDSTTISFTAAPAPPAADGDFTGDDITDLITVGGVHGLPSGLWLAVGDGTGAISPAATNLGAYGNGGTNSPTAFNGAQIVTGRFFGSGPQDILVYYPTGQNPGGGVVLKGNGDGSPIRADLSGNSVSIFAGMLGDINNLNPIQLASAGNSSGHGLTAPDLIAISGDDSVGYYLNYYARQADGALNYNFPTQLNTPTPTGAWTGTPGPSPPLRRRPGPRCSSGNRPPESSTCGTTSPTTSTLPPSRTPNTHSPVAGTPVKT
ncbi:hypothetical protein Pflav_014450 [Phytohabitans flavus]|uniref:Uncharacterized protein n=1 Tax=Phytohabitans flavus TaxID=1076124 RepID=A0A6F8XMJ9_9ACTN|nr:hypothetical protein [Phytohabitans flavus]BCB75035.1 hypothetical protein Pflav_014450 [Phytohabitans flavus]